MAIMIGVLSLAVFSVAIIRANSFNVFATPPPADVVQQGENSGQYGDQLTPDSGIAAAPHSHAAAVSSVATTITTSTTTTGTDQQQGDYSGQYGDQLAPDTGSSGETAGEAPETTT